MAFYSSGGLHYVRLGEAHLDPIHERMTSIGKIANLDLLVMSER